MNTHSGWGNPKRRADGVRIEARGPFWSIFTPQGQEIHDCPCCGRAIYNEDAARNLADHLFPMKVGQ
jgi:hypothetical protein